MLRAVCESLCRMHTYLLEKGQIMQGWRPLCCQYEMIFELNRKLCFFLISIFSHVLQCSFSCVKCCMVLISNSGHRWPKLQHVMTFSVCQIGQCVCACACLVTGDLNCGMWWLSHYARSDSGCMLGRRWPKLWPVMTFSLCQMGQCVHAWSQVT